MQVGMNAMYAKCVLLAIRISFERIGKAMKNVINKVSVSYVTTYNWKMEGLTAQVWKKISYKAFMNLQQQLQTWIKPYMTLFANNPLFWKATENKKCLLPCSWWRAKFLLVSKHKYLQISKTLRLTKFLRKETWSKLRKKSFKNIRKLRKKWVMPSSLNKLLTTISTAQSTLIFLRPEQRMTLNWIR